MTPMRARPRPRVRTNSPRRPARTGRATVSPPLDRRMRFHVKHRPGDATTLLGDRFHVKHRPQPQAKAPGPLFHVKHGSPPVGARPGYRYRARFRPVRFRPDLCSGVGRRWPATTRQGRRAASGPGRSSVRTHDAEPAYGGRPGKDHGRAPVHCLRRRESQYFCPLSTTPLERRGCPRVAIYDHAGRDFHPEFDRPRKGRCGDARTMAA